MGAYDRLALAARQKATGVTGDQTSPWDRVVNTPNALFGSGGDNKEQGVAHRWFDSATKAKDAWSHIGDPVNGQPPTAGQKAARIIRGVQQTAGAIMGAISMPKDLLDVAFANLTAPLAAMMPSLPAATIAMPYLGSPHIHAHPPSTTPPAPPIPLPSIGMVALGVTPRVLINYMPAARCGDIGPAPTCGAIPPAWFEIFTGSSNVFIGGNRAARIGDICRCCIQPASSGDIATASKALAAVGKVAAVASKGLEMAGIAMGALGVAADIAEAAVEDDDAMEAAKILAAATGAAQMSMDLSTMAVKQMMGKDPGAPPAIGALLMGHPNVLIGGFSMINIPNPIEALLNRLKRYKAQPPPSTPETVGEGACPLPPR